MPDWKFSTDLPGHVAAEDFVAAVLGGAPVEIAHATIDGDVILASIAYSHQLSLRDTVFTGRFDLGESRFARSLDLTASTFEQSLNLCRARIDGRLLLDGVTIRAGQNPGSIDFRQIQVSGDVTARGCHCTPEVDLEFAQISGGLILASSDGRRTMCESRVSLRGARIGADMDLRGACFRGDLRFVGADIGGYVLLNPRQRQRTEVGGDVWIHSAKVGGRVVLTGIDVKGDVLADDSQVDEGVFASSTAASGDEPTIRCGGSMSFAGSKIGGGVSLPGIQVAGDLSLANATIQGALAIQHKDHPPRIAGSMILVGASVFGEVFISGAQVGQALLLDRATVHGDVFGDADTRHVSTRTTIAGAARLHDVTVTGSVGLRGCRIDGNLELNGAHIGGGFYITSFAEGHRTHVGGSVMMPDAEISRGVHLGGAEIGGILYLANTTIHGDLSCISEGSHRTEVRAHALMPSLKVSGGVLFRGATLAQSLNLYQAEIEGVLGWDLGTEIGGALVLEGARVTELRLDGRCCQAGPLNLAAAKLGKLEFVESLPLRIELAGCEYRTLLLPAQDYRALLRSTSPFRRDPYFALERWLRDRGEEDVANDVYLDLRRRHRAEHLRGARRVADWLLDWSVRYGIKSYRLAGYLAVVLCLSALLFSQPGALRHDPVNDERPTMAAGVWVAAQMTFPMVSLAAARSWKPSPDAIVLSGHRLWLGYDGYASITSFLSWIVVPLFVAGVSGLLKKHQ